MQVRSTLRLPAVRRAAAAAVLALLGCFAVPAAAHDDFHLHLLRSDPAADAMLATPPAAVRLTFSERPELAVTTVRITGAAGHRVALSHLVRARGDAATVVGTVRGHLANGAYTVAWRTMSHDGHPMHGSFQFHVGGHDHAH